MTKEQEKAIKVLEQYKRECIEEYKVELDDKKYTDEQHASYLHQQIESTSIVLNMLKEQQKEIDILKNHLHYKICENCQNEFKTKRSDARYCKECRKVVNNKEWYRNLTEEQREKRREQAKISMRKLRERRKTI